MAKQKKTRPDQSHPSERMSLREAGAMMAAAAGARLSDKTSAAGRSGIIAAPAQAAMPDASLTTRAPDGELAPSHAVDDAVRFLGKALHPIRVMISAMGRTGADGMTAQAKLPDGTPVDLSIDASRAAAFRASVAAMLGEPDPVAPWSDARALTLLGADDQRRWKDARNIWRSRKVIAVARWMGANGVAHGAMPAVDPTSLTISIRQS